MSLNWCSRWLGPWLDRAEGKRPLLDMAGRCLLCGASLGPDRQGELCPSCAPHFQPFLGGCCLQCGRIVEDEPLGSTLCLACRKRPRPWERLAFFGLYQGRLREVILEYKLQGQFGHSRLLRTCLAKAFDVHLSGQGWDCLIPVPLHRQRLRKRGFNQCQELVRGWAQRRGMEVFAHALVRVRPTPSQTGLSRHERRMNVQGAFESKAGLDLSGHNALLVDDVFTTGSTLEACARALSDAGVRRLAVLVLARTAD
jgi:ComF family protein